MLTLEEIENISFRKSRPGGYRAEEVDDFVDKVIKKVKALESENRELESRIDNLNEKIQEYKEKEDSVQDAIITAQMTAKQIVMEAAQKSTEQLSEANEEAQRILNEAKERSKKLNKQADEEIEQRVNKALRESSDKIEENNEILDAQKKKIIGLMGEALNFRSSLMRAYKEHLSVINSMAKGEDFKKYQKEIEDNYPPMHGNKPETVIKDTKSSSTDDSEETLSHAEQDSVFDEKADEEINFDTESVSEVSDGQEENSGEEVLNKRQPVVISAADKKKK